MKIAYPSCTEQRRDSYQGPPPNTGFYCTHTISVVIDKHAWLLFTIQKHVGHMVKKSIFLTNLYTRYYLDNGMTSGHEQV